MRAVIEVESCGDFISKEMWPLVWDLLFLEELEDPRTLKKIKELREQVGSKCASATCGQFSKLRDLLTQETERAKEGYTSVASKISGSAASDEQFSAGGLPSGMADFYANEVSASQIGLYRRLGAIKTVGDFLKEIEQVRFPIGGEK